MLENIQQRSVNTGPECEIPTIDEMDRAINGLKYEKHPVETKFQQQYGNTEEPICPI